MREVSPKDKRGVKPRSEHAIFSPCMIHIYFFVEVSHGKD